MTDFNKEQLEVLIQANQSGFVNQALASGCSEAQTISMHKRASVQQARREKLAKVIVESIK